MLAGVAALAFAGVFDRSRSREKSDTRTGGDADMARGMLSLAELAEKVAAEEIDTVVTDQPVPSDLAEALQAKQVNQVVAV